MNFNRTTIQTSTAARINQIITGALTLALIGTVGIQTAISFLTFA